jgi:hypothetical protein
MQKKAYLTPTILTHQVIRFETDICSACADTDKDGGYNNNGQYVDNDGDGD